MLFNCTKDKIRSFFPQFIKIGTIFTIEMFTFFFKKNSHMIYLNGINICFQSNLSDMCNIKIAVDENFYYYYYFQCVFIVQYVCALPTNKMIK